MLGPLTLPYSLQRRECREYGCETQEFESDSDGELKHRTDHPYAMRNRSLGPGSRCTVGKRRTVGTRVAGRHL